MHFGGLLSFAFGGTVLLFVLLDMLQNYNGPPGSSLPLEVAILGFIGFLLIGFGLFVNMKSAKKEIKPNL